MFLHSWTLEVGMRRHMHIALSPDHAAPEGGAHVFQSRSQYVHHLFCRFPGQNRQYLMSRVSSHEELIGFGTGAELTPLSRYDMVHCIPRMFSKYSPRIRQHA